MNAFALARQPRTRSMGITEGNERVRKGTHREAPAVHAPPVRPPSLWGHPTAAQLERLANPNDYAVVVTTDHGLVIAHVDWDKSRAAAVSSTLRALSEGYGLPTKLNPHPAPNRWRKLYDSIESSKFVPEVMTLARAQSLGAVAL